MNSIFLKVLEEGGGSIFKELAVAFAGHVMASAGTALGQELVNELTTSRKNKHKGAIREVIAEMYNEAQVRKEAPASPQEPVEEEAQEEEIG